jgi:hypothetical protein
VPPAGLIYSDTVGHALAARKPNGPLGSAGRERRTAPRLARPLPALLLVVVRARLARRFPQCKSAATRRSRLLSCPLAAGAVRAKVSAPGPIGQLAANRWPMPPSWRRCFFCARKARGQSGRCERLISHRCAARGQIAPAAGRTLKRAPRSRRQNMFTVRNDLPPPRSC